MHNENTDYLAIARQAQASFQPVGSTQIQRTGYELNEINELSPSTTGAQAGQCLANEINELNELSPAAILAQLRVHGLDLIAEPAGRVYLDGSPEAVAAIPSELVAAMEANWPALRRLATPEPTSYEEIDLPEPCTRCGSLELWQNCLGDWRCQSCNPPVRGMKLLERAARLRQQRPRCASREVAT